METGNKEITEEKRNSKSSAIIRIIVIISMLAIILSAYMKFSNKENNYNFDKYDMDIRNVKELRVRNNPSNLEGIMKMLEDDNKSVLFNLFYLDEETNELALEPIVDSDELNEVIRDIDTVDKFNAYIQDFIFDPSPIYNSPIVNKSNKINCYGYTLLTISFLETHMEDKYYYKVIQDHGEVPHVYLDLYDKETDEFIRKVDLTIQSELKTTRS